MKEKLLFQRLGYLMFLGSVALCGFSNGLVLSANPGGHSLKRKIPNTQDQIQTFNEDQVLRLSDKNAQQWLSILSSELKDEELNSESSESNSEFPDPVRKKQKTLRLIEKNPVLDSLKRMLSSAKFVVVERDVFNKLDREKEAVYSVHEGCLPILKALSGLEYLDLSNVYNLTNDQLRWVIENCPKLKSVNISGCPFITDFSLFKITEGTSNLHNLEVSSFYNMDPVIREIILECQKTKCFYDQSFKADVSKFDLLQAIKQHCTDLEKVKIESLKSDQNSFLCELFKGGHNLKSIYLCEGDKIDNEVFSTVGKHCPNLESVSLLGCTKLTDFGAALVANKTNLKVISLAGCEQVGDNFLIEIGKHCPNLESADFSNCTKITNRGVCNFVIGKGKLASLDLYNCFKLSSEIFESIAKYCPNLETLDCQTQSELGISIFNEDLQQLTKSCSNLKNLSISNCNWYAKNQNQTEKELFTREEILRIKDNFGEVTDEGFFRDAKNLSNLKELSISGFNKVTDLGFGNLIFLPNLEALDIRSCSQFTNVGLLKLGYSKSLKSLFISSIYSIDESVIDFLRMAVLPKEFCVITEY